VSCRVRFSLFVGLLCGGIRFCELCTNCYFFMNHMGCFWSCKKNSSGNTAALHAGAGRQRQAIAIKLLYACLGLPCCVLTDMIMI
jgi:hypothetical protein